MKIYTRKQYLAKECSHRDYYSQFVTSHIKTRVQAVIGLERLKASTDKNLNDIELQTWDRLGPAGTREQWDAAQDFASMAGLVCIYKEAAKQIIESCG
jgi:hypothetical protein